MEIFSREVTRKVEEYNKKLKELKTRSFEAELCTNEVKKHLLMQPILEGLEELMNLKKELPKEAFLK